MKPIIEINNLGKKYTLVHDNAPYGTLRDTIVNFAKNPFAPRQQRETFWALKNINLNINKGDIVGIIGKNSAGKSTLLKILSGITKPTEGKIKLYGRVSSLLEVGTGFHPELTGRENIFMNGVILGMSHKEVTKKFDQIVEFAGIEKFLDTQVKHYSSGMYVRLAFAVAAHLEPDILIVDEVLAVGDAEFQKKCLGKMGEISKEEGRTVLFVSHNMQAIQGLCNKTILIENGILTKSGQTEEIVDYFSGSLLKRASLEKIWRANNPGNEDAKFDAIRVKKQNNSIIFAEDPIYIEIDYRILKLVKNFQIGIQLKNEMQVIFESADILLPEDGLTTRSIGKHRSICTIPANFLNSNTYSISLFANRPHQVLVAKEEDILSFTVSKRTTWSGNENQQGMIRPKLEWIIMNNVQET